MSQEKNVELVRRGYEAFNRWAAQPQAMTFEDAALSLLHPEVEFHTYPTSPEAGVYRGRDAVISYNQRLFEQFESTRIEVEELVPVGDPDALAQAVSRALDMSPSERQAKEREAHDAWLAHHAPHQVASMYGDLYWSGGSPDAARPRDLEGGDPA